jgi:hypothetical protein
LRLHGRLVRISGPDHDHADALGNDFKGRISFVIVLVGIGLAFVNHWLARAACALPASPRLIPDQRIERAVGGG